jgi:hypothetical protein
MEKQYFNNDFEQFVKQNADQYRMFPSEKVWDGIHNRLHTRRRWYGLGLALLLISTGVVTWVMLVNPGKKQQAIANIPAVVKQASPQEKISPAPIAQNSSVAKQTAKKEIAGHTPFPAASYTTDITTTGLQNRATETSVTFNNEEEVNETETTTSLPVVVKTQKTAEGISKSISVKKLPPARSLDIAPDAPVLTKAVPADVAAPGKKDEVAETSQRPEAPILTIESVVNAYKKPALKKKLSWQAYITPVVSYRTLNENQAFINAARASTNSSTPAVTYLPSDLEAVINHRPDIGFQLGVSGGYPLSKKIKLLSGLQFNVSKYDIRAYNYSNEIAIVALSTAAGRSNTVIATTNYRIEGGYNRASWLRNFYFSASVPVGVEVKLAEGKRNYFGFTATAQPTYILDNRSYLVSTDYKNYVQIPSLTRKWNVNTGFEVFAGVKTGKTEFRIGPQVRYQTLSSYKNKYPIEERLFDFGLKLGVMLK